ncbi:MAG TPA: hypothetical protein VGL27_16805 [Negativicutes bacterium]
MVVAFSWYSIMKKVKISLKIVVLAIIIFYILPKLLTLFWNISNVEPKIPDEHLLEKPLRVTTVLIHLS